MQESCWKKKDKINKEGERNLQDKDVVKRLHVYGDSIYFIAMKDHKETFGNKRSIRLMNQAKNKIECIRKVILDKNNLAITSQINLNQRKNAKRSYRLVC